MRIVVLALAVAMAGAAAAHAFKPTRTVEVVVHTGPGGGSDLLARAVASMIEKEKLLPVRMQVVNKTGGGGALAAAYLAEKAGEQHTIGFFTGVWLTSPLTSAEAKVTLRDLTPVARLVLEPALIAVKADAPYKTLGDFIAAAKQQPGQLKQSGGSVTSRDNVVRQLLQKATGARWAKNRRDQVGGLRVHLLARHGILRRAAHRGHVMAELPPVAQRHLDDSLPARHRRRQRVVAEELDPLA
ncbi:MAG: hypothetical protein E6H77_03540 [Betaproteobacteria bacterium]|nr:MAG: hypothetical protein E6H77_03540 [Betaproteobacteria bacterium]